MKVSTVELIKKLKEVTPQGFEVSNSVGALSTTKAIYIKKRQIFLFGMEEDFIFKKEYGYTEVEFVEEYSSRFWVIAMTIN